MPKVNHRLRYANHDSLVIDRKLLEEVVAAGLSAGWALSGCELTVPGERQISVSVIDDLSQVSPHLLKTVQKLKLSMERTGAPMEWAFINFEKINWLIYGKPFSLSVTSCDEGSVLGLKSALLSLVTVRRQWYSLLSRGLWYWVVFLLVTNLSQVLKGIGYVVHRHFALPDWLAVTLYSLGMLALVVMYFRSVLFPATEFNLVDPPADRTRSEKLRKTLAKFIFGIVGTAIVTGVIAALTRHLFS